MGEAIFAKYSKSSPSTPGLTISNSTKIGLGLDSNATLDDCLMTLAYRSDSIGTVIVTVKDIDGSVVPNANVWMNVPAGAGTNLVYTTDSEGKCIFKTNAGTANFSDHAYDSYIDVSSQSDVRVDCPVGSVKSITLQRTKSLSNGAYIGSYTSSRWVNFSPFAGTVDITCVGAAGAGGVCSSIFANSNINKIGINSATCYHRTENITFYYIFECRDSNTFIIPQPNIIDLISVHNKNINLATCTGIIHLPGGNGKSGQSTTRRAVNICNRSSQVYPGIASSSHDSIWCITGFVRNQSSYSNKNVYIYNGYTMKINNSQIRCNGDTGDSSVAFGVSAAGGAGGVSIPYMNMSRTPTYDSSLNWTGGGVGGKDALLDFGFCINKCSWGVAGNTVYEHGWNAYMDINIRFKGGSSGTGGSVTISNFYYK